MAQYKIVTGCILKSLEQLETEAEGQCRLSVLTDTAEIATAQVMAAVSVYDNAWLTVDVARAALTQTCERARSDHDEYGARLIVAAAVKLFVLAVRDVANVVK